MNLDDAFPSKYLKASDLPEEGVMSLTIDKVEIQEIGMEKQRKPVISFEESEKGFVCNKTNANTIARIIGSRNTDDWHGKTIKLFRTEVEFQGEMVESIRVSTKPAKSETTTAPEKGNW
jgi:hypothetical protein